MKVALRLRLSAASHVEERGASCANNIWCLVSVVSASSRLVYFLIALSLPCLRLHLLRHGHRHLVRFLPVRTSVDVTPQLRRIDEQIMMNPTMSGHDFTAVRSGQSRVHPSFKSRKRQN